MSVGHTRKELYPLQTRKMVMLATPLGRRGNTLETKRYGKAALVQGVGKGLS